MEEGEEEEWEELEEEDELNIQQQQEEDEMGARFRNYRLHVVSREMGMEAIFNVPQQLQSSSTLLHLGSRCFCYVMTGMPPHPKYGNDHAIEDDKVRVISIVIFRAVRETYKEGATRLFRAKFLHSAHYAVKTSFPNEGVIHGCFSLGWDSQQPQIEAVAVLQGWHTQAMGKFQTQYQAERSPFDKQELGSNILVAAAAGIDYLEGSAKSRSIGEVRLQPINESDSSTGLFSQRLGKRSDDSGESRTSPTPEDWRGCYKRRKNTETWAKVSHTTDDDHAWQKYGQKEILNAKHPRSYFRCTRRDDKGCQATKQVQRMEEDPQMFQITCKGLHTCKDTLKGPQIIREPVPWFTYFANNPPDSMWGNSKQADHDQALSSSTTPTIKQESKEEALSDLIDNLSSLGTKQADHDQSLSSSTTPTIKQESKEEALSDLTGNHPILEYDFLNLRSWSNFNAFNLVGPAIMPPKLGSDKGDVVSTTDSRTETASHGLDFGGHFDGDFDFDGDL